MGTAASVKKTKENAKFKVPVRKDKELPARKKATKQKRSSSKKPVSSWRIIDCGYIYTVDFFHSLITGARRITVDGVLIKEIQLHFKLVGEIKFKLLEKDFALEMRCGTTSVMQYKLYLEGKLAPTLGKHIKWDTTTADGTEATVIFVYKTFNIYSNDAKLDPHCGFGSEDRAGSTYKWMCGDSAYELHVSPALTANTDPIVVLEVSGRRVDALNQSEKESAPTASAASGGHKSNFAPMASAASEEHRNNFAAMAFGEESSDELRFDEHGDSEKKVKEHLVRIPKSEKAKAAASATDESDEDASEEIGVGTTVEARLGGKNKWYKATVMKVYSGTGGTTYDLQYEDGDSTRVKKEDQEAKAAVSAAYEAKAAESVTTELKEEKTVEISAAS